jgi:hypothetical protein
MTDKSVCTYCGQLHGIPTYDDELWSIYDRIRDGRSNYEPLIFTSDWMQENIVDDEDHDAMMHAMEKDMYNRGLCIKCGRPDLRNVKPEDVMSEEEAQELHEMWAEQAAERRAGC